MTSKWEREVISRITRAWVDMHCRWVTERDFGILRLVDQFSMLTTKQLAILHPEFCCLRDPINGLNRRLRKMWQHHILDRAWFEMGYGEGTSPAVYAVGSAGAKILEVKYTTPFKLDTRGTLVLPTQASHKLGVNDMACELTKLDLLSGWQSEFKILSKTADAFVDFPLFLEYDTGTEDRGCKNKFPTVMTQLEKKYRSAFIAGWNHKGIFPAVIFVTKDKDRVKPLRDEVTRLKPVQVLVVHTSGLPKLLTEIKKSKQMNIL